MDFLFDKSFYLIAAWTKGYNWGKGIESIAGEQKIYWGIVWALDHSFDGGILQKICLGK